MKHINIGVLLKENVLPAISMSFGRKTFRLARGVQKKLTLTLQMATAYMNLRNVVVIKYSMVSLINVNAL